MFPLLICFVHLLYLQVSCAKSIPNSVQNSQSGQNYRNSSRLSNMVSKPKKFKAQPHHVIHTKVASVFQNSSFRDSFKNLRHKGTHIFWPVMFSNSSNELAAHAHELEFLSVKRVVELELDQVSQIGPSQPGPILRTRKSSCCKAKVMYALEKSHMLECLRFEMTLSGLCFCLLFCRIKLTGHQLFRSHEYKSISLLFQYCGIRLPVVSIEGWTAQLEHLRLSPYSLADAKFPK